MINLIPFDNENELREALSKDKLDIGLLGMELNNNKSIDIYKTAWYKIVDDEYDVIGVFVASIFASNTISIHGGLYKPYRSIKSVEITKECLKQLRQDSNCVFVTTVVSSNTAAVKLARKCGFRLSTIIKKGSLQGDLLFFTEKEGIK